MVSLYSMNAMSTVLKDSRGKSQSDCKSKTKQTQRTYKIHLTV